MNKEMSIKVNNTPVSEQVKANVVKYLADHSLGTLISVVRASEYPVDDYLYHVIAKKGESYSVWTSWNETTLCLNHGHYGLTLSQAVQVHYKFFRTISGKDILTEAVKKMLLKIFTETFVEKVLSMEDDITEHTFLEDVKERFFDEIDEVSYIQDNLGCLRGCVEKELLARLGI